MRLEVKSWFLAAASLLLVATAAWAEDYQTRPVKLLVGFSPGGAPDTFARIVGQRLSEILKQPFIVDNKPGAGGMMAAKQNSKEAADGYSLVVVDNAQIGIVPYIYKDVPYDPIKDFTPIGLAVTGPMVLISNAKTTTIKTLADLIRQAKAKPGTINYGSTGIGGIHHIAMEVFCNEAGIALTHIPYKGSGQSVPALLGGQVDLVLTGFTASAPYVKSGQVNPLAVTSLKRVPDDPEVPAFSEFYKGYDYAFEIGILGPAGLSPEIVAKLSGALKTALEGPDIKEKLRTVGVVPTWLSPKDYAENIRENLKKYKRAVEIAHITPK